MARGSTDLDSQEYDQWLAKNKKERVLLERKKEKQALSRNYSGWHFGLGERPVHTKDKAEFKKELDKRGLMMRDDVRRRLR